MKNFTIRSASLDDVNIACQLITSQNMVDYGESVWALDDLRKAWTSPAFNLELDTLLAFAPNGEPAGYAELREKSDPFIYLANNHQDIELAGYLLCLLENRALSQKAPVETLTLYSRASEKNKVLKQTFESNGYISSLSFLIMETVLTEQPDASQWADGITVHTFVRGQDEQATYQVDEEASEDKGYHSPLSYEGWAKRMGMDREDFDPTIWFLACEGDETAGVALNVYARETNTGWVDHLSVRRAWRKRGIGKALLLHTFAEFFRRGIQRIKLSVDSKSLTNAPRLYESVGMKTIQQYHIYKKEL